MKQYKIELKWALIFVAMMLGWMVLERLVGLHDQHIHLHPVFTNLIAIPAILIYVLALLNKRERHFNGYMNYSQGFITGLVITLFVTVLAPLVQIITSTLITPDYFANVISYSVREGKMSQMEAEAYFNLKSYIIQVLIGTPAMGIVTAAIVALFTRKKRVAE
jgi:hypothetical protein